MKTLKLIVFLLLLVSPCVATNVPNTEENHVIHLKHPSGTADDAQKSGISVSIECYLLNVEYNDRREHVTWDFDWFRTLTASVVSGSDGTENVGLTLPELQDISIMRGEFYGAVKYNGQWKACVLYSE